MKSNFLSDWLITQRGGFPDLRNLTVCSISLHSESRVQLYNWDRSKVCSVKKKNSYSIMQCFHKQNLAMRTWRSKALQWEKRDLLSRMRPKCGPNLELLRTPSRYFHQNAMKSLQSTFCDKSAMLFVMEGMLYNSISQEMHALTLVLNLIDTSLSLFHSFTATFLSWLRKWDLLCEMRPKCGPFHQFGPHADQVRNCGLLWKQCFWFKISR